MPVFCTILSFCINISDLDRVIVESRADGFNIKRNEDFDVFVDGVSERSLSYDNRQMSAFCKDGICIRYHKNCRIVKKDSYSCGIWIWLPDRNYADHYIFSGKPKFLSDAGVVSQRVFFDFGALPCNVRASGPPTALPKDTSPFYRQLLQCVAPEEMD